MVTRLLAVLALMAMPGCAFFYLEADPSDDSSDAGGGADEDAGPPVFTGDPAFVACETTPDEEVTPPGVTMTQRCAGAGTINGVPTGVAYFCARLPTTAQLLAHDCGTLSPSFPGVICCPTP